MGPSLALETAMQRSSFLFVVALAMLVTDLGGCGNSGPPLVDSKLSELAPYASLSLAYATDEATVTLQISNPLDQKEQGFFDDEGSLAACPNVHATATANGQPMQFQPATLTKQVSPSPSDDGSEDTSYDCSAPIFSFTGSFGDTLAIVLTDESGAMTFDLSNVAVNPTMALNQAIFTANQTIIATTDPPPGAHAYANVAANLWALGGGDPNASVTATGVTFVVPEMFAMSIAPQVDGGSALADCIDAPPGPCAGGVGITVSNGWAATTTQCSGATSCTAVRNDILFSFDATFVTVAQ